MKKIFLLVCVAIMATSCIKNTNIPSEGEEFDVTISEVTHDGHSYILFEGYGVVHNPDCECKKMDK